MGGAAGLLVLRPDRGFPGPIAEWLMYRAALHKMTADPIAELPDGLHLAVCGAGSPLADPDWSGPCLAVIAGRTVLVVDAGEGGARNLQRMGIPPGRIAAVFLTHFHSDHIDGLGELAMLRWTTGSHHEPLPVYGPPGVERVVDGFNAAYALDAGYRTAHHGPEVAPPSGAGARAMTFPVPQAGESEVVWQDEAAASGIGLRGRSCPATPAVGYRVDYGGRSLVISGDTRPSPEVARAAAGADLLVHEALSDTLVGVLNRAATAPAEPMSPTSPTTFSPTTRPPAGGANRRRGRGPPPVALPHRSAAAGCRACRPRSWMAWTTSTTARSP